MYGRFRKPSLDFKTGLGALVLGFAFAVVFTYQYDPDFWWSLRIGELILWMHAVPQHLNWSFLATTHPFISQEWGSEALYALLWLHGGMIGILVLMAVVTWVGLLLGWLRMPAQLPLGAKVMAICLTLVAGDATWGPRAQMFTFWGIALLLWGLEKHWDSRKLQWGLVLTFWIWGQVHGGFALGLGFWGLYLLGTTLEAWWRGKSVTGLKGWWLTWIASGAVVMFNPNGVGVYVYVVRLLHGNAAATLIQEWQSPNFHDPRMWALIVIFMLLGAAVWSGKWPLGLGMGLLLGGAAFWALDAVRNVVDFTIVAMPGVAVGANALWVSLRQSYKHYRESPRTAAPPSRELLPGLLALGLGLGLMLLLLIPQALAKPNYEFSQAYPVAVVRWVCQHPQTVRIFGPTGETGWLLAAMDPSGRPGGACSSAQVEAFGEIPLMGAADFTAAANTQFGYPGSLTQLQRWRIQAVWTTTSSSLNTILSLDSHWRKVLQNQGDVIYVPTS